MSIVIGKKKSIASLFHPFLGERLVLDFQASLETSFELPRKSCESSLYLDNCLPRYFPKTAFPTPFFFFLLPVLRSYKPKNWSLYFPLRVGFTVSGGEPLITCPGSHTTHHPHFCAATSRLLYKCGLWYQL